MGSDLKLTGLASGFDWQPLVDKLIELESVPKRRLEAEKVRNNEKISELGILKSQLVTLNGSATALQNEDLFNARSVGISPTSSKGFSASAAAGALTGDFELFVHSLASKTEMSSENRQFGKLASGINLNTPLKDLPISTKITLGTFTISGRTFSVDNLNASLQDVMDKINATSGSVAGVNPESDMSGITMEYDASSDKMYFDTNEQSPTASSKLPVLGSSTDTSNFLRALRLLDRSTEERDAELETGSVISIFNPGDGNKAWIHSSDSNLALNLSDDRLYAAFGGMLYERQKVEGDFNASNRYQAGDRVYDKGFVYESTNDLPSNNWSGMEMNSGDSVQYNGSFYQLLVNLDAQKVDSFDSVDAGAHAVSQSTNPGATTSLDAYKAGDLVKAADGTFFRSIKDRTMATAVNWNTYAAGTGFASAIASQGWAGNIPAIVANSGRMYELSPGVTATEHGGATDSTIYDSANGWGSPDALIAARRVLLEPKIFIFFRMRTIGATSMIILPQTPIPQVISLGKAAASGRRTAMFHRMRSILRNGLT